jgi:hypothetical protein
MPIYDTMQAIEELRTDIILAGRQEAYGTVVGGRFAGTSIVERRATKLADSALAPRDGAHYEGHSGHLCPGKRGMPAGGMGEIRPCKAGNHRRS